MNINNSILISILSVLTSALVYFLVRNEFALIIAFLTFISIGVLRLQWIHEKSNQIVQKLSNLYDHYKLNDDFSEIALLYNLKSKGKVEENKITVKKDEIYGLWYDYASRSKKEFKAVTFALSEETFDLAWASKALNLQQGRILQGCTIERIFLFDSQDEFNKNADTIKRQVEIGIKVGSCLKIQISKNQIIKRKLSHLKTYDFAIIDDKMVGRLYLNEKSRKILKADLTSDKKIVNDALFVFKEIKKLAIYID